MTDDPSLFQALERSRALGFLGPGPLQPHIDHAQGFVEILRTAGSGIRVLDLGSGGGLPGLVIASSLSDVPLTLLDANERRVAFLRDALRQLGRADVKVAVGRAEVLARGPLRERFDVLVARSFGAPAVTAECGVGFLRPGGRLLVSEPDGSTERWPVDGLALLGLAPGPLHHFDSSNIQELVRTGSDLDGIPRRVGLPARTPRF